LGVDLVPFKTCTYDCIYCQLGRTTCKTVERKEWVPIRAVLDELKLKLQTQPDYITLSGSGEPTLHSRIGELIKAIQAMTRIPVAVLTNGSLLWQPEVRAQLARADVVMPSLDAGDDLLFEAVNRPHAQITFEKLVSGLEQFRREYSGQYWLEVMLLAGRTAPEAHVQKIGDWVRHIQPDRVQLNTATRPPAEEFAAPVSPARMDELARLFSPPAEVIAGHHQRGKPDANVADQQTILDLLRRRPCTEEDVAAGLAMRPIETAKHLADLEAAGRIVGRRHSERLYYYVVRRRNAPLPTTSGDAVKLAKPDGMTPRGARANPPKHRKNRGKEI